MSEKSKRYGVVGTTVFHVLLLLLLIFFGLASIPKEEEGILVNFGDTVTGFGAEEPRQSETQPVEKTTPPPPTKTPEPSVATTEESKTVTQDFDDAPVIKSEAQKKKEKEEADRLNQLKKEQAEKDKIRKAEEEKIRQEEIERQKKAEEERKIQEEKDRQAAEARNKVKNAFSGKGTGDNASEGDTQGSGNQGYVTGDPNSKNRSGSGLGNSGSGFDLTGRSLVGGLPKPQYNIQEEGIVVIEITVDKNGFVTSAVPILRGSTTQNNYLREKAVEAAKKAKFNVDKNAAAYQKGTITYAFELN